METIRVAVAGAAGRMGSETCRTVASGADMELVLAVDRSHGGESLPAIIGPGVPDISVEEKLGAGLDRTQPHVLVDFTHAATAATNACAALRRKISPIIGTSGISDVDLREVSAAAQEFETPAMLVPNFAIGAVLMMQFARLSARWLPDVEIIEMHHDQKADAPSGTAKRTAELIAGSRSEPATRPRETILVEGVRGGSYRGVNIHSVRLKGLVAHQMVMFGGPGETLTIRHDSLDRKSFMEGVKLCIRGVRSLSGLVIGLDDLLKG